MCSLITVMAIVACHLPSPKTACHASFLVMQIPTKANDPKGAPGPGNSTPPSTLQSFAGCSFPYLCVSLVWTTPSAHPPTTSHLRGCGRIDRTVTRSGRIRTRLCFRQRRDGLSSASCCSTAAFIQTCSDLLRCPCKTDENPLK